MVISDESTWVSGVWSRCMGPVEKLLLEVGLLGMMSCADGKM